MKNKALKKNEAHPAKSNYFSSQRLGENKMKINNARLVLDQTKKTHLNPRETH